MDIDGVDAEAKVTYRPIRPGDPPPCIRSGRQCRNCYGWENMLAAARRSRRWRLYPLCCPCTGLTVVPVSPSDPQQQADDVENRRPE